MRGKGTALGRSRNRRVRPAGPWVAGAYYKHPDNHQTAMDGWLRTGEIANIDVEGYIQIVDRTKDLVKRGVEWISSVDLENAIMEQYESGRSCGRGCVPSWRQERLG